MTDKTFNKVEPLDLRGDFRAAWLLIPEWRINVCAAFDYADAIALQDWLAAATGHFPQREGWVSVPREPTAEIERQYAGRAGGRSGR
jgi:hypothetical protein